MRIGYLVPRFPAPAHLRFWHEMQALQALGHTVVPLSLPVPDGGPDTQDWALEALDRTETPGGFAPGEALGALARLVPRGLPLWILRGGPGLVRAALPALASSQALLSAGSALALDHLHVQSGGRMAMAAALSRRMGGPAYSVGFTAAPRLPGAALRFVLARAAFLRVPGLRLLEDVEARLGRACPVPVCVSRIGVDAAHFARDAAYAPPERSRPVQIAAVGRPDSDGGFADLLAAMRQLLDQGVDVRLTLAETDPGGAADRAGLERRLRELRLQDHVRRAGWLTQAGLKDVLQSAHLLVEPRRDGRSGAVVLEAMAMGIPVLATGAEDDPPVLRDGASGLLVDAAAPGAMARAIRDLVADPERLSRYGEAGRAHVVATFPVDRAAGALAEAIAASRRGDPPPDQKDEAGNA